MSCSHTFRQKHLLAILEAYDPGRGPLDLWMSTYFRAHSSLGSKDRAAISESIYGLIRWLGLVDYLLEQQGSASSWKNRCTLFSSFDPFSMKNESIPRHIRVSMPKALFDELVLSFGEEKAAEIARTSNTVAPTTVRINPAKIDRDTLLQRWQKQGFSVSVCRYSPFGVRFAKKTNFFTMHEFTAGLFEVQDEASQLVGLLVNPEPGDHVLDFCAGSGGKTLAFAYKLQSKGQIYLHDVRTTALAQAKRRMKRAGVENVQFIHAGETERLQALHRRMDWVLVDAPCSGTGTLRRNPDMKWKVSEELISGLVREQRAIFEQALGFLKKKGTIIYATCSLLSKENEEQMRYFIEKFSLQLIGTPFKTLPQEGEMDGFFAASFRMQ